MSDFKLEFTLKQHTPMIHFQSDHNGATLRATELKPKLDRFLLERIDGLPFREQANGARSLDYKVRIQFFGKNHIDYPKPYVKKGEQGYVAPYFADGESIDHNQNVQIVFQTFNKDIYRAIEEHIHAFFALENFGTRQTKGFGCYLPQDISKEEFETLLSSNANGAYRMRGGGKNPKDALHKIDTFYREIKSGTNYPKYQKSLLFRYMCDHHSGWEKKWLKEQFPNIVYGKHQPVNCSPRREYHYIRALLGLAEHNEYYPKGQRMKLQIKIKGTRLEDRKSVIQRFRSPITFKVFNNSIYLYYDTTYETILDEEFTFSLNGQSRTLSTPEHFNIGDFLNFVANESRKIERITQS